MPPRAATISVPALLALVLFLSASFTTASELSTTKWSPLLTLRPRHLLALYPLLADTNDYAPLGSSDGYQQHGRPRNVPSAAQSDGTRLEMNSGIDLPLQLSPRVIPQLTIGAWIQLAEAANNPTGCIFPRYHAVFDASTTNGIDEVGASCPRTGRAPAGPSAWTPAAGGSPGASRPRT